ncbi:hypothetical protein BS47DRAFT_1365749 [Hydnum rufescens UP504]|uniref:Uncharacterized protein n=1 Tax=Hydnum rufescens UP504 TaxID=1448309 RepID=A0A9P6AMY8_9AGAM|nr:hypothetical protein BS47DRAFT_1365749 [Hydnum rufescens UP504]
MDHSTRAICCTSEAIHSAQNLGTEVKAPMDSPAPKESPFPLPQPTFLQNGWLVDAHGRIFARSLSAHELPDQAYIPGMSADDPRTAMVSFYEGPRLSLRHIPLNRTIKAELTITTGGSKLSSFLLGPKPHCRWLWKVWPGSGRNPTLKMVSQKVPGATTIFLFVPLPLLSSPPYCCMLSPVLSKVGWWTETDPMPSLPNTVRAAGGQYPPRAEAYVALNPSTPKIPPAAPSHPYPRSQPPHTPEMPPRTFEASYSLRDAKDMSSPEPRPSYHQGTQYRGSPYRPEKEEHQERTRLPQALPGTPPIDQGTGTLLPLALARARLIGWKTRSIRPTGRHTGRIELPGPDPTRDCPRVGIEIVEEALPAAGKAVGALEMKVKMGVRIPGPQNNNDRTPPSSKWVEGSTNRFPSGRSCCYTHEMRVPSCWKETEGMLQGNIAPNGPTTIPLASKAPNSALLQKCPAYTNASLEYLERIVGPRSPLEASYLKGFQYLKRLDALGAIAQSPFKDEMNVLETYKTLRPTLQRGHLKFEEWCSEVHRLEGKTYLSLALVRLATHMALDTIAYLGSLESPVFSPNETLMGAIFGPSLEPQAPEPGTPDNGMRWNAVLMERLGVPCWGIMPRVGPQRLDFDAGGRPDADPLKEADFQKGMRVISQDQQPLQVVVYSQKCPCSPPSSPPVGPQEFSDDLKAVIIQALDSEMPDAYTIEESSAKLKGLLGSKVWSGRQYEDGSHMERQGRVWYQTRDIPLHLGAHNSVSDSLIEAPKVMTSAISPNKPSVLQGVLAFKGSLVLVKEQGIRQKDSQKVLEINLLFKRPDQQDAVLQRLRESDPKVDAHAVDMDPHNWRSDYQHFFDEGYIRQLFADPQPIKDIEALLELAPPSSRPINTREAAKTVAVDMERARQALLLQMFEAGRAEFVQYAPKDCRFFIVLDPNLESPEYTPSKAALEADAKRVEAVIAQVVEQSKNKGSAPGSDRFALYQGPPLLLLQLLTQDLQTAKPCRTKPVGHASDSTVRPTSDSTVRPALDSAATCRSNRSKLKEEALHVQPKRQPILCRPLRSRKQEEGEARIQQDPEAAEVAKGLEGLGDEGDGFSKFPADQFEEPPGSEEEQRGLLGLPTVSETEAFGPNALHKAYSKGPGEALKDTGAPSSSESNCMVPSFEDSTTDGEYMSGLEEAMNNERNPKDLARLEAERVMRLEAWQARAAELAEEHAVWHHRTKGKGKETEVEVDDEAEEEEFDEAHTKPLVSRLTKSQTEHVKQQVEEERERYAALAQEMQSKELSVPLQPIDMPYREDMLPPPPAPPHRGFHVGTNYATDRSPANYGLRSHVQYSDHVDDPERRASYGSLLYQLARCFEYRIETLNLAGPLPRVQGIPSFHSDPYSYQWQHLNEWGTLGKFEWTRRTQLLPMDANFPLHRAFITFDTSIFKFDLCSHIAQARGQDPSLHVLERGFIEHALSTSSDLIRCLQWVNAITSHNKVELLSELDPNWHYGSSWMHLIWMAGEPQPPWKMVLIGQEIHCHVIDGIGYLDMAIRVLIYILGLQAGFLPVCFRTTSRLAGLIVDLNDAHSKQIGEGLALLGAPIWGIRIRNLKPPIELLPRGSTKESDVWKEAYELERPSVCLVPEPSWLTKRVQHRFEEKLRDLTNHRLSHPPVLHWVIERGHPKQAESPGPFHQMHLAHLKQIKKFLNESYYEAILKWLQLSPNIGLRVAFHELWEAMGKATIPNANLPASRQFPFVPSILHGNFSVLESSAQQFGLLWVKPAPLSPLAHADSLAQQISKPATHIFEDPDKLDEFDQPSSRTHPRSASPEERRVCHKSIHPTSAEDDRELSPYDKDLTPYADTEQPEAPTTPPSPVVDPLTPTEVCDALPTSSMPAQDLERELYVCYQGVVRSWYLNDKELVLLFNDEVQACRVAINQIQAAKDYPMEPSAKAIPFVDDKCYHSWSPNAVYAAESAITSCREARKSIWPALPPGAIPADRGHSTIISALKHFINPAWNKKAEGSSPKRHYLILLPRRETQLAHTGWHISR